VIRQSRNCGDTPELPIVTICTTVLPNNRLEAARTADPVAIRDTDLTNLFKILLAADISGHSGTRRRYCFRHESDDIF
jgi:hypothetical protein